MKRAVVMLVVSGLASAAWGDAKSDAQAKVDAAKKQVCEKEQKFLADQKAKGRCVAEADEASKITCAGDTEKDVRVFYNKCLKPPDTSKPADSKK